MKTNYLFLLIALSLCFSAHSARGADQGPGAADSAYIEETFFPVYISKNDYESAAGGSATKSVPTQTGWGIDTHTTLGYVWNNVLVGLTYNYFNVSSSRPRTPDAEGLNELTSKQEFGVTFGYFLGHWRFTLTDFLSADKTFTQKYTDPTTGLPQTDETHKNSGGSGFQISIGYDFQLGGGFGISPTLLYRNVTYTKQSYEVRTGSSTPYPMGPLQTKAIDSDLNPMITVNYRF